MTIPWEGSHFDSTRALTVYNIMRSQGLYEKIAIRDWYSAFAETYHGGPYPDLSTEYIDLGTAFLEANGFVTVSGSTLTPTSVVGGKPAPIRRVPGNDFALEFVP